MKEFTLNGQDLHTLNHFSNCKNCTLLVGGKSFNYSMEQLAFLSPLALSHFMNSSEPFQIEISDNKIVDFVSCFDELDSLFHSSSSIKISHQNVQLFSKIAKLLDNFQLFKTCETFPKNEKIFSFNLSYFKFLRSFEKKSLHNFTLIINNVPFQINYQLFCCLSDLLFKIDISEQHFSVSVSNDVFDCFCSFLKIFEGLSFHWRNFQLSTILSMIHVFHLHSLQTFLNDFFPSPKSVDESLKYLSLNGSSLPDSIFQQSVSILVDNFFSLTFEQLSSLSIEALQHLFNSDKLQISDEDYKLNLILKMIEKDSNKRVLLKNVQFRSLSSRSMKEFINSIHVDDVDFELFEHMKEQFQNLIEKNEKTPDEKSQLSAENQELKNSNKKLAEEFHQMKEEKNQLSSEIQHVKDENNILHKEKTSLSSQIQNLNQQNEKLSKEKSELSAEIQSMKKQTNELKNLSQQGLKVDLNGHSGIISMLRQKKSDFVVASASSIYDSSCNPENVFFDDEKYFLSNNTQNSWICFHFKHNKITLSGYLLRSGNPNCDGGSPRGWELEGSNDEFSWFLIDSQSNQDCFRRLNEKQSLVNCSSSFCYFRFTQTEKNNRNQNTFWLKYVEFFGTVFDE